MRDGVDISDFLKEQYPDEMTIIIQHHILGAEGEGSDYFEVRRSTFKNCRRRCTFPSPRLTRLFSIRACSSGAMKFRSELEAKASTGPVAGAGCRIRDLPKRCRKTRPTPWWPRQDAGRRGRQPRLFPQK